MKRLINNDLTVWSQKARRKPLIIRGARQVGKTYSIKEFGKENFDNTVCLDLERNPGQHRIFEGNLDAKRIRADIEVTAGQRLVPGKTLLFIDEIQACPRAITALRYFYEELPELHVIAAGSLLEFALKDISFPVGRLSFLTLHPLSFTEYLNAAGQQESARIVMQPPEPVSPAVHENILDHLRRYFFIGGMPECVKAYTDTGSLRESFAVQAELCHTFRLDFAKYAPRADKQCLETVWTTAAKNVGRQTKYASLAEGYSNPTLKKAYTILEMAQLFRRVPSVDPTGLPLGASASAKVFKTIMLDIGLMGRLTGSPVDVEYNRSSLLDMYRGALAEQFVGQELLISQEENLYYWSRHARSSTAEVDFVAVKDGAIIPVEVKSGPAGRLKSLHLFLEKYRHCRTGIVFSGSGYREVPEHKMTFLPLYYAFSAFGGRGTL